MEFFKESIPKYGIFAIMGIVLAIFVYMDWRYLDIQYLAFTSGDEYMQYHSLLRMYEGILGLNIEDIFRFDSYVYGFVWHLLNLAVVAPFHAVGWSEMAIFMPRLLNAIFATLCLGVIYKISRIYLKHFYSYAIVLMVACMSGFYWSGYSFKPDVFQALLLLISAYFLIKDNFHFKRNFIYGILFFALSVGIAKIQAIMFLPLIYLYIGVVWLKNPNVKNIIFCVKYGILSTLGVISMFILTNPYILHPRGFGVWSWLFLHNMQSNKTNHGSYIDVSFSDKLFKVIDFYYFEILIFALLIGFCVYFIYGFFAWNLKNSKRQNPQNLKHINKYQVSLSVFFPIIGASIISLIYLFSFVNKTWSSYYVSSIYLLSLALIPLFIYFPFKKLAAILLIVQIGGGISNNSYTKVFHKYNKNLDFQIQKSDDLLSTITPLIKTCKTKNILTDNPSFAFKELGLNSKNIYQIFGLLTKDMFILDEFMKESNSKNPKYFANPSMIILRKDSMWFDKAKIKNPNDEFLLKSLSTIKELESLGFKRIESKYFYIYVKDC
ncbi:hypothetical protein CCY99_08865 [Helicobacter sp. 16-1353]|uniref:ArnT family glycosyltransferase n=1 Tax=Helicobacter sp. 16-1353 TaxID=2004996 RepID=UPI000DCD5BC7|nr:glycosyltransferase family 39 protein [Helicobacter sp. 16-1353]RAX51562.1 hypothetical protein CCY99_08865 [Helicobacter sp. 16-1353]